MKKIYKLIVTPIHVQYRQWLSQQCEHNEISFNYSPVLTNDTNLLVWVGECGGN